MINKMKLFALASMMFALTAFSSSEATVVGLFNTGMNGNPSIFSQDPSWSIISAPPGVITPAQAYVVNPNPAWIPNDATSKWIGPVNNLNAATQAGPGGMYDYRISFNVTSPITMTYSYSVDNILAEVKLTGPTNYDGLNFGTSFNAMSAPITISNINVGSYTMDFFVFNALPFPFQGPTGLRVAFTTTDLAVPEPTTYASLGAMLALGLLIAKKRQSRKLEVNG